ncbi:MAG: hypothetical protein M5U34_18420 [Chloroflexi bacterium]|nr:hypothetical protein [Chloroflexota bacterium]
MPANLAGRIAIWPIHAAFPVALTPDMLYQIWNNFRLDVRGNLLNIPWVAVADLLLSNLCDEVGHELYQIDGVKCATCCWTNWKQTPVLV